MLLHWIWFNQIHGLTDRTKLALLEYFHDPEDIYCAEAFQSIADLKEEGLAGLLNKDLSEAETLLEQCVKTGVHLCTWKDSNYPAPLRGIPDPPVLLYYRGLLPDLQRQSAIGVVGTRKASVYGLSSAKHIAGQLARCGSLVVTGMAHGIDTMAAVGALDNGGRVIGVLGCGADRIYPTANRQLYARVLDTGGCLFSEYPPGTPPNNWHFPRRNRIISGLSQGVLVVEAPEKSGALITARYALEQGRDVFAVPGNLGVPGCAGSNGLLRDGAALITCGWDILLEYADRYPETIHPDSTLEPVDTELSHDLRLAQPAVSIEKTSVRPAENPKKSIDNSAVSPYSGVDTQSLSPEEKALFALLTPQGQLIDDVIAAAQLPSGVALAALTMLEIKGITRSLPGRYVALK